MIVVLDADVVIGALDGSDAHHETAREQFTRWRSQETRCLLSLITLTEILIAPAAGGAARLAAAREAIAALEIATHMPNEAVAVAAARLRGRYPISLPDAYVLATAHHVGARVASFDRNILRAAKAAGIAV